MPPKTPHRPRPILMIPIRRCGSHAFRLRLNFSPDFYSPYPLHIIDFLPLVRRYGDLENDDIYFQMILDLVGLQNSNMCRWEKVSLDPMAIFEAIKDETRSPHRIAWEMLFCAGRQNNAKVVMDKSLDNVQDFEELVDLFEDMLFLHVVRDPRAQISSINRAIIHDFDTTLNSLTWVKAQDTAQQLLKKYPERVLTIRYEDFLGNQETTLQQICQFFGIEFMDAMLDVSSSSEAQTLSKLSALWENNAFGPISANIDKFKKQLSLEEINIIETLAGDYMDLYGYERMTRGTTPLTQAVLADARERSAQNKLEAWDALEKNNIRDYQLRQFRAQYLQMLDHRLPPQTVTTPLTGRQEQRTPDRSPVSQAA